MLALRWSDIVDGRAMIARSLTQTRRVLEFKCTKTEEPRPISLPVSAIAALEEHRKGQDEFRLQYGPDYRADLDLIFAHPDGSPFKPDSISAAVSLLFRRLELPKGASLHSLRHTHTSHLLASGVPLTAVSARLGHASIRTETIAERFERDREKLLPLPPAPLEACEQRTTRVSSQALVRYETNDYSVPTEYGHRQVLVKAFVWEVVIGCSSEVIARHSRSYGREEMIFNPLHYLALLEQKTNALDQAAPLEGWPLPEELIELRRQMEVRLAKHGRREFVQVLRLLETFSMAEVSAAAREALRIPAISFDAVKHLLLCAIECRVPKLDLENYPHLPVAEVALTRAADYQVLLAEAQ
jgi:hypothetical protein